MSEKAKKKPLLLNLKKWTSKTSSEPSTPVPSPDGPPGYRFQVTPPVVARSSRSSLGDVRPKRLSAGGIKDLVQCPLCLEVLSNPKMLPCQHTFCQACLLVYVADVPLISCPICNSRIQVTSPKFVNNLPTNLYINSLLQLVGNGCEVGASVTSSAPSPPTPDRGMKSVKLFAGGARCMQCQSMCDNVDVTDCQHCKQKFCRICWSQHLDDMQTQIASIVKQLDSAATRLDHKVENFKDRFEHLTKQINIATEEKINSILQSKEELLKEAGDLQKSGDLTALALKTSLDEARVVAAKTMESKVDADDTERVKTFMNLHQNALQILSDVSKWDAEKLTFDKDNFCIDLDASTPLEAESDEPLIEAAGQNNPLESEESLVLHYRSRNFIPHYIWRKTSRPCGIGISPWTGYLYICGMDSHSVLIVERTQAKIVARITHDEMLCPIHIAFMKSLGEIYVTDKWKHCVHVFNRDGDYLRSIGQKGSRLGMFRSPEGVATDNAQLHIFVVDTGNDRVQVLQSDGKFVDQYGVNTKQLPTNTASVWQTKESTCTELNAPTSVAVTNDRVIILDSGNRRVKVYNKSDKNKIAEFGALGQRKGQFRQPEVLAVDPLGFILVGDSGNSRIQVFKQNGQLVRVFGGLGTEPGKFGWISGIHVTKQMDIIVSDTKNHSVHFI